jgi:hypothetical protein
MQGGMMARRLRIIRGALAEDSEPTYIHDMDELTAAMRMEVDAGNVGHVLDLLVIAEELAGEEGAQQVYADIVWPGFDARWRAWLHDEPGAPDLGADEIRILVAYTMENASPSQLDAILALIEEI